MERPRRISDLGFLDVAGEHLLHDGHRVDVVEGALSGHERWLASFEYLRKTVKNAGRLAKEVGDDNLAKLLDQRCEWLAGQTLRAVSDIETELRARGYHEPG
uniref:Uncharacterized protein n=2 Tax=Nonomuraea gerenzanensis TaxID=93944 RepID=A0A1M4BKZ1_9ACTN|nr:hypothetical protein BN4615_P10982 [Nonomuraea gerenzanensis]